MHLWSHLNIIFDQAVWLSSFACQNLRNMYKKNAINVFDTDSLKYVNKQRRENLFNYPNSKLKLRNQKYSRRVCRMSIQVENNLMNTNKNELFELKAHYIPCRIEEDGPANVDKYFEPYVVENGSEDLSATFRGYPLDGTKITFPKGYRAVVVTEAKRPLAEDADRRFQVTGGFKEFTYWNWDKKPSKNDNMVKALDWIDIADAIHGD